MGMTAATIASLLEAEIRAGRLLPGSRLPTHRDLAQRHGVALNTASLAMTLLAKRGLAFGEVGRGSFVRTATHIDSSSFRIDNNIPAVVNLAHNVMPLPGLSERFELAARAVLRRERDILADYQPHGGRTVDRAAGAAWLSRQGHLPNDPSRVVVCAGAQHAVTVALLAVAKPGDAVAVEALTWPGIKASAAALGLEVVPIPMDRNGLKPAALLRVAVRRKIAALYCMPSLHNPTGVVLPGARRETVAAIARRLDFQLVEDDAYGFLAEGDLADDPPMSPPLAAFAPERTWHIRSTSKSFVPGLRASWLLVPPGQEQKATDLIRATIWTAPPIGAAIASLWVGDGTAAKLEAEKRQEADERQRLARSLLQGFSCRSHPRSMHLWVELPAGSRPQRIVELAAAAGVWITPGAAFGITNAPNAIRLALGAPPLQSELVRALTLLQSLW